jgi:sulfur carrier protein ThiS
MNPVERAPTTDPDKVIHITVRLHAVLRGMADKDAGGHLMLELPANATVGDIRRALGLPQMDLVFSLPAVIVDEQAHLKSGDVVDIIPAISGGCVPQSPPFQWRLISGLHGLVTRVT